MKRVMFVLSLVLASSAALTGLARATVLLDNYSTNQSSEYVSYAWVGSPAPTFAISNGLLTPTITDVGGGFYWNGGQTLHPGDSVSAIVTPNYIEGSSAAQ